MNLGFLHVKVYLSPIVDCFDGAIVSWTISSAPNMELVNRKLNQAVFVFAGRRASYSSFRPWCLLWIGQMVNSKLIRSMF